MKFYINLALYFVITTYINKYTYKYKINKRVKCFDFCIIIDVNYLK